MEALTSYFPSLSETQLRQFETATSAYQEWNEKINVISRKDIEHLEIHHFLHSLGIAKFMHFKAGAKIIDIGTGGGFPGVPLAIFFPSADFILVDSIGKKLKVIDEVCLAAGIKNVHCIHSRAENINDKADYITGRAVTAIPEFFQYVKHLLRKGEKGTKPNGILYLKGGDLVQELEGFPKYVEEFALAPVFKEDFFETKKLIFIPA